MEASKETGLLSTILPPRLEDAGLEDCALPPDSIKEAFFKAASAVKSRTTSIFADEDQDCLQDPFPDQASDALIGGSGGGVSDALIGGEVRGGSGPCVAEKGVAEGKDKVVVGGADVGEVDGKDCSGGTAEVEGDGDCGGEEAEDEGEGEKPTLVEGVV